MSVAGALLGPFAMSIYAHHKRALDWTGIAGAWAVGTSTGAASHRMMLALYFFFFSSSSITRVGESLKQKIEGEFKQGGYRNWWQVMANGGVGMVVALVYLAVVGRCKQDKPMQLPLQQSEQDDGGEKASKDTASLRHLIGLQAAHVAAYAACNGDTWASELGVLSPSPPVLITTLQTVPPGTNGGVSFYGLLASTVGGLSMGLVTWLYDRLQFSSGCTSTGVILQATLAGFVGSGIDSLLGAVFQYSGAVTFITASGERVIKVVNEPVSGAVHISGRNLLSNNQVNLLSAAIVAALGYSTAPWFLKSAPEAHATHNSRKRSD